MKFLKRLLLILVVVVLGLYLVLMIVPFFSPRVNDQDLTVPRKPVTDAKNGFVALQKAARNLWWPEDLRRDLADLLSGTNWNEQLAALVLSNNTATLQALDEALQTREFQVPDFTLNDDLEYLHHWRTVGMLLSLRAKADFRAGREAQAFSGALAVIELGNRMLDGGGAIIHGLVATSVQDVGLANLREWCGTTRLPPEELIEIAIELSRLANNGRAYTNILRVEYLVAKQFLTDMRDGKLQGQNSVPNFGLRVLPIYNERKTFRNFAAHTRALISAWSQPYTIARTNTHLSRPAPIKMLLGGNAVGDLMLTMMGPITAIVDRKCQNRVDQSATMALVALRAHQLRDGRLPVTLEALVPEFLSTVPMDDFDGQPLRYDPARRLLYSVGKDCRDDGGVETSRSGHTHTPDHVFSIQF